MSEYRRFWPGPYDEMVETFRWEVPQSYNIAVYGPIAAYLVELFPARVRYTSLSIPYHFGNGWFGGGVPLIATTLVVGAFGWDGFGSEETVDYWGLIYPITIATMTAVVGFFMLRETHHIRIWDEVSGEAAPATTERPARVVHGEPRTQT